MVYERKLMMTVMLVMMTIVISHFFDPRQDEDSQNFFHNSSCDVL